MGVKDCVSEVWEQVHGGVRSKIARTYTECSLKTTVNVFREAFKMAPMEPQSLPFQITNCPNRRLSQIGDFSLSDVLSRESIHFERLCTPGNVSLMSNPLAWASGGSRTSTLF